ncbi:ribonuclease T2 family protein [Pontibaca methylaminivorans]|uniref:Ribonuclease T2 n=1 Tax=Pontibaca methylaminivorans TaxID=515897 RepID=A0A1R3X0Y9_9RHOB|nr:ribonuclease T2 [Pontibaca methylaminivorans]SIT84221.1 ribonuclease T2 [Pontibaca methylaminivorans]
MAYIRAPRRHGKTSIRRIAAALFLSLALSAPTAAGNDRAGAFDYYILALSWSPNWCAAESEARGADQCDREHGWILHGLWPQHERGYPAWCQSAERPPPRRMTAAMADIMGSAGLAWHQWRKHGSCSGLSAAEYFARSRAAHDAITLPPVFDQLRKPVRLPASVVEEAFLKANPGITADMLSVTCRGDLIAEVRLCLTRELEPRACGRDVARDCALSRALMLPRP